ncbi:MAG: tRNA (adenosine(37)-N6)-threonylcarbamoyltransferase complex ATPase subunit type 1 TsaE [Gammaproteobacteria bacterium]
MSSLIETLWLPDVAATEAAGRALAERLPAAALVFLHGDLGAGKTTLVRAVLRGLGYAESVKSPTYTIIETHDLGSRMVYHFDLYRIMDPDELWLIGIDDVLSSDALKLVEWPERGAGVLPVPDVELWLWAEGGGRRLEIRVRDTQQVASGLSPDRAPDMGPDLAPEQGPKHTAALAGGLGGASGGGRG